MRDLHARMNDLSRQGDERVQEDNNDDNNNKEEDDGDGKEEEEYEDSDSGSALPNLEGSSISSIDDLIRFAQAKRLSPPPPLTGRSSLCRVASISRRTTCSRMSRFLVGKRSPWRWRRTGSSV